MSDEKIETLALELIDLVINDIKEMVDQVAMCEDAEDLIYDTVTDAVEYNFKRVLKGGVKMTYEQAEKERINKKIAELSEQQEKIQKELEQLWQERTALYDRMIEQAKNK